MNKLLIIVLIAASLIWSSLIWSSQKYDQNRLEKFTGIFGINLRGYESRIGESLLISVKEELGEAPSRRSGDASEGVESICYLWPDSSSVLEFDEQEAGVTFTIRRQNNTDHLNCLPLSWEEIGKKKLEVGGLRLGLTKNEVKKLIGLPTKTAKDTMYFNYKGKEKFSKKALEINSSLKPGSLFFHQILITTIFKDSILIEFSVYESQQH